MSNADYYSPAVIEEWLGQITEDNIKEQLTTSSWIVCQLSNEIIGFCQYNRSEGKIYQIQVLPKYQRQGYGTLLYKAAEKDLKNHNQETITLLSTLNAVRFYQKLGFKIRRAIMFPLGKTSLEMKEMEKEI